MARGLFRKTSFWKTVGAFRSQWKRALLRFFLPGYGKKGMGWLRNPKKAAYNWWYHRTSISIPRMLGYKPSRGACFFALCAASIISAFALPFDAASSGVKATKIHKARKARTGGTSSESGTKRNRAAESRSSSTSRTTTSSSTSRTYIEPKTSPHKAATTETVKHSSSTASSSTTRQRSSTPRNATIKVSPITHQAEETKRSSTCSYSYTPLFSREEIKPSVPVVEVPQEPDENTPKSTPKHEKDQYIRKRMIIAGSSYCDTSVLAKLKIGTYFDLEAEPDNPFDKDAVKLIFEGEKIGYIAKTDRLAFVTCLKLRRNIYGVITNINIETNITKYEYETWFDNNR